MITYYIIPGEESNTIGVHHGDLTLPPDGVPVFPDGTMTCLLLQFDDSSGLPQVMNWPRLFPSSVVRHGGKLPEFYFFRGQLYRGSDCTPVF